MLYVTVWSQKVYELHIQMTTNSLVVFSQFCLLSIPEFIGIKRKNKRVNTDDSEVYLHWAKLH